MRTGDLVNAALLGFELGEAVMLPSLHGAGLWDACAAARTAMAPYLSSNTPAPRYHVAN